MRCLSIDLLLLGDIIDIMKTSFDRRVETIFATDILDSIGRGFSETPDLA